MSISNSMMSVAASLSARSRAISLKRKPDSQTEGSASACERIEKTTQTAFDEYKRSVEIAASSEPIAAKKTKPCDSPRFKKDSPPLFRQTDALFQDGNGVLPMSICGFPGSNDPIRNATYAETTVSKVLQEYHLAKSQLHGAQLVHGSLSPSLSAFLPDGEGVILPSGLLAEKNRTPFCGTLDAVTRINSHSLSTCWVGEISGVCSHVKSSDKWTQENSEEVLQTCDKHLNKFRKRFQDPQKHTSLSPDLKREFIQNLEQKDFKKLALTCEKLEQPLAEAEFSWTPVQFLSMAIFRSGLELERQKVWPALPPLQKQLIEDSFGVIYGIKSERPNSHCVVDSSVYGEIGLAGGASGAKKDGEIRVIFVPPKRVEFVKNLLADNGYGHIPVEGSEHLFRD